MRTAPGGIIGIWLWLTASTVFAQAPLPTHYTGPWEMGVPPAGWTFSGLGSPDYFPDYDGLNDGAAKLAGTGAFIEIAFSEPAAHVTYWIKGLSFSGGTFEVQESVHGVDWTVLQTYAPPPTNAIFQDLTPSVDSRFIRFIYVLKGSGNVGLDGISIRAEDVIQLRISAIAGGKTNLVSVLETLSGRTYALEYTLRLDGVPVLWSQADSASGTGSGLVLKDRNPIEDRRFYRVRDATP